MMHIKWGFQLEVNIFILKIRYQKTDKVSRIWLINLPSSLATSGEGVYVVPNGTKASRSLHHQRICFIHTNSRINFFSVSQGQVEM